MKINKTITIILLLFIIISNSCKKKDTIDNIVPATQIGANTFGCIINGEICKTTFYKEKNFGINLFSNEGVTYSGWAGTQDSSMRFYAVTNEPNYSFIFNFKYDNGVGIYHTYNYSFVQYTCTLYANNSIYETDNTHIATIDITKSDLSKNMIAGTFEMELVNKKNEVIHVSEGRFDIQEK
jgi:hypothetical protein